MALGWLGTESVCCMALRWVGLFGFAKAKGSSYDCWEGAEKRQSSQVCAMEGQEATGTLWKM